LRTDNDMFIICASLQTVVHNPSCTPPPATGAGTVRPVHHWIPMRFCSGPAVRIALLTLVGPGQAAAAFNHGALPRGARALMPLA